MTENIDVKVQKLFERLSIKKKEVAALEKPAIYKTNLSFPFDVNKSERLNIQTATIEQVAHAFAFLIGHVTSFDQALKKLGAEVEFVWGGSTFDDWEHDMTQRVSRLNITQKKKELADLEKKLNNVVSPEQRRVMEVEELTKALD